MKGTTARDTRDTVSDSRVTMVQEHLLGVLLAKAEPRDTMHSSSSHPGKGTAHLAGGHDDSIGHAIAGVKSMSGEGDRREAISPASTVEAMDVDGVKAGNNSSALPSEGCAMGGQTFSPTATESGSDAPGPVQTVASMVDRVLKVMYLIYTNID